MGNFVIILLVVTGLYSCGLSNKVDKTGIETNKTETSNLLGDNGLLHGTVGLYEGNCMPTPSEEHKPCATTKVKVAVYVTLPSHVYKKDLEVANTVTNDDGYFEFKLEPGEYSIFVYDNLPNWKNLVECGKNTTCDYNGAFICNAWSGDTSGKIVCSPFVVKQGESIKLNLHLNHASW